jgi:NAD(P)-dependent dehydrogenase (short-subunit alcohol dehydrogenase family)
MLIARPIGGKVVVITGSARGVGEALAVNLAARGARVALVGLEPERLAKVAERCGPNSAWWECDITDAAALARVVDGVRERFNRVDVLVANAGIAIASPFVLAEAQAFDRVVEVNLLGSIRTVRAFAPMLLSAGGYYLQIASIAALAPTPLMSAYAASKSGVEAFALALRPELAHHGAATGVAYLAFTDTDMTRGSSPSDGSKVLRKYLPGPLGRLYEVEPTVERLVTGIECRAPFVYGQPFLRWLRPVRWLLPSAVYRIARRIAERAETSMIKHGVDTSHPLGAGGEADAEARRRLA